MANEYICFGEGRPFSDVVVVDGELLYLSGMVSEDFESGEILHGDITTETRQTLNNMEMVLKRCGSDMGQVIRVEVLLHDVAERDEMNVEYVKHFPAGKLPVRVCYGGVDLAAGCKIEIMAIARKAK